MDFYDIHSHILAKVDDGAETFEMSCRMLDMAYEEGIRHLCVTPHYNRHNAEMIASGNPASSSMIRAFLVR